LPDDQRPKNEFSHGSIVNTFTAEALSRPTILRGSLCFADWMTGAERVSFHYRGAPTSHNALQKWNKRDERIMSPFKRG
jgi:hypothetical protein